MKELVEVIAKALVDEPDQVVVTEKVEGRTTVIEVHVAEGDMGKVIGKQGRTARALRALLGAASSKAHRRVMLEIVEWSVTERTIPSDLVEIGTMARPHGIRGEVRVN